jgi:hypothetical protein
MDFEDEFDDSPNYYSVLELKPTATNEDIKIAYRRLAVKFHPDKNPDSPTAEIEFKMVLEAYEILSDPEKRKRFDAGVSLTDDIHAAALLIVRKTLVSVLTENIQNFAQHAQNLYHMNRSSLEQKRVAIFREQTRLKSIAPRLSKSQKDSVEHSVFRDMYQLNKKALMLVNQELYVYDVAYEIMKKVNLENQDAGESEESLHRKNLVRTARLLGFGNIG